MLNFARLFYFGRDVQIMTFNDAVKIGLGKQKTCILRQYKICPLIYCAVICKKNDMRKLPAVLKSQAYKEFSFGYGRHMGFDEDMGFEEDIGRDEDVGRGEGLTQHKC